MQIFVISVLLARFVFPRAGMHFHPDLVAHAIGLLSPIFTSYWAHKRYTFRPNSGGWLCTGTCGKWLASEAISPGVPLVVDVDGTLLKSDLLYEATLQFVARYPWELWRLPLWLAKGKAHLKAQLAARIDLGANGLPLRAEVLDVIRKADADGRQIYLASASDRRWVEPIAARISEVTEVFASDGKTNLAGAAKKAALVERFGEQQFDYIGDNRVDIPVWEAARKPLLVSHNNVFEAAMKRRFPDMETIARPKPIARASLRALRPHQWAKNLLVFLPVVAGHNLGNIAVLDGRLRRIPGVQHGRVERLCDQRLARSSRRP